MAAVYNVLALLAVCATAAMHWFGVEYSFYWTISWWDIPTHMLGGLTAGLWAAAVASRYNLPPRRAAILIIGLAFAIGVAWEVWEMTAGLSGGFVDSVKDIINDSLAAVFVWVAYNKQFPR